MYDPCEIENTTREARAHISELETWLALHPQRDGELASMRRAREDRAHSLKMWRGRLSLNLRGART